MNTYRFSYSVCIVALLYNVSAFAQPAPTVDLSILRINCYGQADAGTADEVSILAGGIREGKPYAEDSAMKEGQKYKELTGSITWETRRQLDLPIFKDLPLKKLEGNEVYVNLRELDGNNPPQPGQILDFIGDLLKGDWKAVFKVPELFQSKDDNYGTVRIKFERWEGKDPVFNFNFSGHKEAEGRIYRHDAFRKDNTEETLGGEQKLGKGNLDIVKELLHADGHWALSGGKTIFCVKYFHPGQEGDTAGNIHDQYYLIWYELSVKP